MNSSSFYQPVDPMERKRAAITDEPSVPIFLRKTFEMISTCDTSLASWFDTGTTFVVKKPEQFAAEVIPMYFKHSNFSSFVRQLNFYGFRKIKANAGRLNSTSYSETQYTWRFGHRAFLQGRPELLVEIKKDKDNKSESTADKHILDQVSRDNADLKRKLADVEADVDYLNGMIAGLVERDHDLQKPTKDGSVATVASSTIQKVPPPESAGSRKDHRDATNGSNSMGLTWKSCEVYTEFAPPKQQDASDSNVNKLREAIAHLPPNMQDMFVDRMVGVICSPDQLQQQVDAVRSLASSAATIAHCQASVSENPGAEANVVSAGSAILESFLEELESKPNESHPNSARRWHDL